MSLFLDPLVLSLTVGILIFIVAYRWADPTLNFILRHTLGSQEEIVRIFDALLIQQKKESLIRNCWLLSILMGVLGFFIVWPNVILSFIFGIAFLIGTWLVVKMILRSLWEKHCNQMVEQMVESLTIMSGSLKVGLGLSQAIERVIKSQSGPIVKEFRLVLNKVKLGQTIEESLVEMGDRICRPDVDMLVTATNILKETGGNLAETFYVMAETIRERQKLAKKIKAMTAQGLFQAKIISLIPLLLFLMFFFTDRNYISPLITTTLGWVCIGFVIFLVLIGWISMKKIVQIKI